MTKRKGSKAKILDFLLKNIGQKVNSTQLQKASGGKAEWARRLRELRDEEGYEIISHNDNVELKPGEYILEDSSQNLRAVCSNCNEGLQNATPPKPDFILLKAQVRRATQDDQLKILTWLCEKFNVQTTPKQ